MPVLTQAQRIEVAQLAVRRDLSDREIADLYGISPSRVSKIRCSMLAPPLDTDGYRICALAECAARFKPKTRATIYCSRACSLATGPSSKLTPPQLEWAKSQYSAGMSQAEIANRLGVSQTAISLRLNSAGIKGRSKDLAVRRFGVWDTAFEKASSEAAYWIGFLITDGWVSANARSWEIGLEVADRDHVLKLNDFLRGVPREPERTRKGHYRMRWRSRQITKDLTEWGVTPRKTFSAEVHSDLLHSVSFWRGAFDGDGCIEQSGRVSFVSASPRLAQQCCQFLESHSLSPRLRVEKDRYYLVGLTMADSLRTLRLLYAQDVRPVLDRKYAVVEDVFHYRSSIEDFAAALTGSARVSCDLSLDGKALIGWQGNPFARVTYLRCGQHNRSNSLLYLRAVDRNGRRWYGTAHDLGGQALVRPNINQ